MNSIHSVYAEKMDQTHDGKYGNLTRYAFEEIEKIEFFLFRLMWNFTFAPFSNCQMRGKSAETSVKRL